MASETDVIPDCYALASNDTINPSANKEIVMAEVVATG